MAKKFNYPDKASFARMTNVDAQAILQYLAELEFPRLYEMSLQFALFKTYGIPTISSLLAATKEFSTPENASKRYADTGVLIAEFSSHPPRHERVVKAIARMNYIHSRYQKAGKISNDDLLYTLSVFVTEPISWINKYEWRDLTEMEICAVGTFWKSMGDAMGIEYEGVLAHSEWADGVEFMHDVSTWAKSYENAYMVPAASNKQTADELVSLLLFYVPTYFKSAGSHLVGVMMGDLLRKAMIHPDPPQNYFGIVSTVFAIRRFVTRHLLLPRYIPQRTIEEHPNPTTGRYNYKNYLVHPFYNSPGFLNRWGPEAWFVWLSGGKIPGSDGDKYIPEGYRFEEVGPKIMKGKGVEESNVMEQKLWAERPSGCPFAFAR
ncbi:hypothetical protein BP6252_11045 [Coleophoma cylindrospora]|uniref:Uncharacterized protein n=1 Tax=Coleophoma cylindrospora TaxID=1849047 RepID=A0A3D8QPD5_9HELO|nr:hypothetical protein BP6252_11045 [Coleophoma cylindrospora]